MPSLYDDIPGQDRATAALEAAAVRPVHAYLLVGPAGTGKRAAALRFAASVLSTAAPDAETAEDVRRRVLAELHPDVVTVEREGAWISIEAAREVTRLSARSPVEGERKVLVLTDFHLVRDAGPALLKTIEEPPGSTIFVILAEYVPPELVTIASRCVRIDFAPIPASLVAEILIADGVEPELGKELAAAAGGRLDRARLLAGDEAFRRRRRAWQDAPAALDGSGATAASVAGGLVALLDESVAPLQARQKEELEALEERNTRALEVNGRLARSARSGVKAGARELEERHRRELRRQRTDELRAGLATLAGVYRGRLGDPASAPAAMEAARLIDAFAADLQYNPGESLALTALFVRLGRAQLAPAR